MEEHYIDRRANVMYLFVYVVILPEIIISVVSRRLSTETLPTLERGYLGENCVR